MIALNREKPNTCISCPCMWTLTPSVVDGLEDGYALRFCAAVGKIIVKENVSSETWCQFDMPDWCPWIITDWFDRERARENAKLKEDNQKLREEVRRMQLTLEKKNKLLKEYNIHKGD